MCKIFCVCVTVSFFLIASGCQRVTPTPSAKGRTQTAQAQKSQTPVIMTQIVTATPTDTPSPTPAYPTVTWTPVISTMTPFPPLRDAGGTTTWMVTETQKGTNP